MVFNLKNLKNKMTSYLALKYPDAVTTDEMDKRISHRSNKHKSNRVFIVHGHDNEVKQ